VETITKKHIPVLFFVLCVSILSLNRNTFAETIDRVVAIVNNDIITLTELIDAENLFLTDTTSVISFDASKTNPDWVRREILDRLIDNKLIAQEVRKRRIIVPKRDIDATIANILRENSISKEELIERLKTEGLSFKNYYEQIKQEMEKRRLVNYEIKGKITLNEDELIEYYTENKDSFKEVKEVRVQHILLNFPKTSDKTKIKEVYESASVIMIRINNGEDFGKLAKIYSQGTSANLGGDMGWFKRGEITRFLEKVVFNLNVGDVSEIIKSRLGFHIIKLMDRKEGRVKPFEEVRDEIKKTLYEKKVDKGYKKWLKDLRKMSFIKIKL